VFNICFVLPSLCGLPFTANTFIKVPPSIFSKIVYRLFPDLKTGKWVHSLIFLIMTAYLVIRGAAMDVQISKHSFYLFALIDLIIIAIIFLSHFSDNYVPKLSAGGRLLQPKVYTLESVPVFSEIAGDSSERFQRPSKQAALVNPYTFVYEDFANPEPAYTNPKYLKSDDVIYAYFGMIQEASDMLGFSGGCGSIGDGDAPLPGVRAGLGVPRPVRLFRAQPVRRAVRGAGLWQGIFTRASQRAARRIRAARRNRCAARSSARASGGR
jgi:hypothetical protein